MDINVLSISDLLSDSQFIVRNIIQHLDITSLIRYISTCKSLNIIYESNDIWIMMIDKDFFPNNGRYWKGNFCVI